MPDNFCISGNVAEWAREHGYTHLNRHLEHFIGYVKANGKTYADWDAALKNAIRDNWAKLDRALVRSAGESLLARTKAAMEND